MSGRIVALLPMKAKSERVRLKNYRTFAGRPLYQWMLSTLVSMDEVSAVVINTDARAVLNDHGFGAMELRGKVFIRDRQPKLCGDEVSMNLIIADDLEHIEADTIIMTHTTNPLLTADTIRRALAEYASGVATSTADSLFTVNRVQTRFYRRDGSPVNHDPDNLLRTQDLEPWFEENSNLYVFDKESFAATKARIGRKPIMFETPRLESLDIDEQDDWILAEAVAEHLRRLGRAAVAH